MKRIKYTKLMIAILYAIFAYSLGLYFVISGGIGVFVISREGIKKIMPASADMNSETMFIIIVMMSILFGMIPFGLVAIKCIKDWMKKWNVPTIPDAFK